jgi:hypothetical protein
VAEPNGRERHLREVVAVMLKLDTIAFGGARRALYLAHEQIDAGL